MFDLSVLWFRRLFERERVLLVMRYVDMLRVHPDMDISHVCSTCGEQVGIYPSGQRVLKRYRKVKLICQICEPAPVRFSLAQGALEEPGQSKWR